jgi:hypothetical protein
MKKHFLEWGLLFLTLPLFSNTAPDPRVSFFSVDKTLNEPVKEDFSNLSRHLTIHVEHDSYLLVTLIFSNDSIKGHLICPTWDPKLEFTEGYVCVGPSRNGGKYTKGTDIAIDYSYPPSRYFLDINWMQLSVKCAYSQEDQGPVLVITGFPVMVNHPMAWDLSGDGSCVRDRIGGTYFRYPESSKGIEKWATMHQGFAKRFENPKQNLVPLSKMLLNSLDYDGLPLRFQFTKAYLRLHNDDDSFAVGNPGHDEKEKWRDFPLTLAPAVSQTTFAAPFVLSQVHAISADGRYLTNSAQNFDRYYLTHQLYLPPVKKGESKTYSFSLVIEGAGESLMDSFSMNFEVYKDKNYFGTKNNSDYAVEVIHS